MRIHPLIFAVILVVAGLVEVGSWPDDAPAPPQTSLTSLAGFALHGRPAPAERPDWLEWLPGAVSRTARQSEHELLPPPHAHVRSRTGS